MVSDKLRELKERRGMTNHEIAVASNIPESTVTRILTGQTENPTFSNVADIVTALGGSVDEVIGNTAPTPKEIPPSVPPDMSEINEKLIVMNEHIQGLQTACEHMHQVAKTKDKWISRMFIYCCVLTLLFVVYLTLGSLGLLQPQ